MSNTPAGIPDQMVAVSASEQVAAEQFCALDPETYYAGNDSSLFFNPTTGAAEVLPAITSEILEACSSFRTIEEHAQSICLQEPFLGFPIAAVKDILDRFASAGFLVSKRQIVARSQTSSPDSGPVSIHTVGVITHGRPDALQRVLESVIENAHVHARQIDLVIADDSDQHGQQQNLAVLSDLRTHLGVDIFYCGPREKREFARALARETGLPLGEVQGAFFQPKGWPGTPGANRNALLLHAVGEAFATLDDDVVCSLATLPSSAPGVSLTSEDDPTEYWYFESANEAVARSSFVTEDFLGLHEELLGRSVSGLVQQRAPNGDLELDGISSDFIQRMKPSGGSVIYTMAGLVGDSGWKESLPYFFTDGVSLDRLLDPSLDHRAALESRQMIRGAQRLTVTDADMCMGFNLGLDNRELLPPFQTAARNEDGLFGILVNQCITDSFSGYLPRALRHVPIDERRYALEHLHQNVGMLEASDAISALIQTWTTPSGHASTARRLASLGAFLEDLGNLRPEEFDRQLSQIWWARLSSEIVLLEQRLKEHGNEYPETWSDDLHAYIAAAQRALSKPTAPMVRELRGRPSATARQKLQSYIGEFGRLLIIWPELVRCAGDLRDRGIRPARLLK